MFGDSGTFNRVNISIMYGRTPVSVAACKKKNNIKTSCSGFKIPGRIKSLRLSRILGLSRTTCSLTEKQNKNIHITIIQSSK